MVISIDAEAASDRFNPHLKLFENIEKLEKNETVLIRHILVKT